MRSMVFWGATGQAKVLREAMGDSRHKLIALFDNNPKAKSPFGDVPLFLGRDGFERWQARQTTDEVGFLVAIGGDKGRDRIEIQNYLQSHGLVPLTCKHQTAFVAADAKIGKGSQILANACVGVEAVIGQGCIINTGAVVDHECILEEGVHICPGARLAGCVKIGSYATVGTGAVILPRVEIGPGAVVGAGAVVTQNVPANVVVVGNPARLLGSEANG